MSTVSWVSVFMVICAVGTIIAVIKLVRDSRRLKRLDARHSQLFENNAKEKHSVADIPIRLSRENWAAFEGTVPNLKQVIVVADVVQQPHDSLYQAVMSNFGRGVHYLFIVSKSKSLEERDGYLNIFKGLATAAIASHHLTQKVEDLVSIEAFPDEWDRVPCVFYRVEDTLAPLNAKTRFKTLAFYGDKVSAGIADHYETMPAPVAEILATALMSGAPEPMKEALTEMERDNFREIGRVLPQKVVEFPKSA